MNKIGLGIAGLVTGVLSWLSPMLLGHRDGGEMTFLLFPGLIFGIGITLYLIFINKKIEVKWKNAFVFVFLSIFAFLLAYVLAFAGGSSSFDSKFGTTSFAISLLLAGGFGSFVLLWAFQENYFPLPRKTVNLLAVVGSILGLALFLSEPENGYPALFIIWQTGMGIGIGWALDQHQKQISRG